jgi:Lar family restriction alleviation protein
METKSDIKRCPFCKNTDCVVDSTAHYYYVTCLKCEARGPMSGTYGAAVAAWNNRENKED